MKLYIGNIPYSATEADLRNALSDFEPIVEIFFPMDQYTGKPRGFAFATLSSREIGEEAIRRLNGADLGGRKLRVNEAQDRQRGGGGGGGGGDRRHENSGRDRGDRQRHRAL